MFDGGQITRNPETTMADWAIAAAFIIPMSAQTAQSWETPQTPLGTLQTIHNLTTCMDLVS